MDFHGIHFADPTWLLGLFVLPFALAVVILVSRAKHATFSLGNPRLVEMSSGFFSAQWITWLLRFLVIALCLIAAARPQAGKKEVKDKKSVSDIFLDLDVSGSMMTTDLKPNRIMAARKFLSEFLDQVHNVRVGLTIFARISFTLCPLTSDVAVVQQLLSHVLPAPYSIKLDGTAIGDSLISCLGRLESGDPASQNQKVPGFLSHFADKPQDSNPSQKTHQAIILLTDGGDNSSQVDPLTAARIVASRGIKVYTIGIGKLTPEPVVVLLPTGQTLEGGIDPNTGRVEMSDPVQMGLLRQIAEITGGKSYSAQNTQALKEILEDIAKLQKQDVVVTTHWEYNDLASGFLMAAFFLLALDLVLEMTWLRTLP